MKNKRQEQIENKRRHKKGLKKSEPDLQRPAPTKLEKPTILIICEGENTEVSYFSQFRLTSARLVSLGEGFNTVGLVNRAIELSEKRKYEQVWCVFDKDDFPANDFNTAINMARANGFQVGYSNQAFEYWILLHFEDHQGGGMNRSEYANAINERISQFGVSYDGEGSKIISPEIFELLEAKENKITRRDLAVQRAKRNYLQFNHQSPANEESSTTVFMLVEEIIKYI